MKIFVHDPLDKQWCKDLRAAFPEHTFFENIGSAASCEVGIISPYRMPIISRLDCHNFIVASSAESVIEAARANYYGARYVVRGSVDHRNIEAVRQAITEVTNGIPQR